MLERSKKNIAVLGSTGSIGTQTLDIIEEFSNMYHADVLTANRNWQLLAKQARRHRPRKVVIADKAFYNDLKAELRDTDIIVEAGAEAVAEAASDREPDIVLTALVGYSGLLPTVEAVKAGKLIALANKETLVAGGEIINKLLQKSISKIIPVDSEHSAIFQCLQGEFVKEARKILLTASGGPFRTYTRSQLCNVTAEQALKHPNWNMGAKVTIDSATMMNKGFEMIEAHWLFGCPTQQIEIVVHPQSIVHSMVEFVDGSIKAQLGVPDMHMPIRYALGYPNRLTTSKSRLSLSQYKELTFEAPDFNKFPLLKKAYEAIGLGGNMPCILNAANEVAVAAFLRGEIGFMQMPELADKVMDKVNFISNPTLEDLVATHEEATRMAQSIVLKK